MSIEFHIENPPFSEIIPDDSHAEDDPAILSPLETDLIMAIYEMSDIMSSR